MIPPTFHRVWLDEPIPETFETYWRRLQGLHHGWGFKTWNDSTELRAVIEHVELFDSFPVGERSSYGFRSDIARYELLARFGGIYVDTDVEPLRPFHDLLGPDPFVAWCSTKELDPAVIASPADHPAIRALVDGLDDLWEWRKAGRRMSPPGTTGPAFVTRLWRDRPDVRRLPPRVFFPFHWSEHREHVPLPYAYADHHWAAGWKG